MGRLDALVLLRGVREVASHADAENPMQVSQSHFDAAREHSHLYGDLPRAKRIVERLRMPWRDVLLLAHSPSSTHAHRLGRAQSEPEQEWLTEDHIAFSLRLVALRLGVESVSPVQYRQQREELLAADRRVWRHGRKLRLPTDEQIRIAADGWDRALALAKLSARHGLGDQGQGKYAATTEDVLDRCFEAHGTELTSKEIWTFVAANGIPYSRERQRLWGECIAAWKQQRRAQGLDVPDGPPPRGQRPNYSQDVGAGKSGERRIPRRHSLEDCVASVVAYLEHLPSGARSTKLGYQAWAAQANAPGYSAFDQHGGWGAVRELALERMVTAHD